jgi:hypothetical protein
LLFVALTRRLLGIVITLLVLMPVPLVAAGWQPPRADARGRLRDQPRLDFFSRLRARFSSKVFAGFFFCSFFRSIPLLMIRAPGKCR